jgi:hypothetical protein
VIRVTGNFRYFVRAPEFPGRIKILAARPDLLAIWRQPDFELAAWRPGADANAMDE